MNLLLRHVATKNEEEKNHQQKKYGLVGKDGSKSNKKKLKT